MTSGEDGIHRLMYMSTAQKPKNREPLPTTSLKSRHSPTHSGLLQKSLLKLLDRKDFLGLLAWVCSLLTGYVKGVCIQSGY
jgi:hypothetical protein